MLIWTKIRSLEGKSGNWTTSGIKKENIILADPAPIVEQFAEHYTQVSSDSNLHPEFLPTKLTSDWTTLEFTSTNEKAYDSLFSRSELENALRSSKDAAPGPDQFRISFLQNAPAKLIFSLR